jgi:phenylacetate-CoA ligase
VATCLSDLERALEHGRRAPFHRDRLPAGPIHTWDEWRSVPLTTKDDLRRQPPWALTAVPRRDLSLYCETSATTGIPISTWYSRRDLDEIRDGLSLWGVGFSSEDRLLLKHPYALAVVAHQEHAAAAHRGASVIAADHGSTITPLARVLSLLQKLEITLLGCLAQTGVMLAEAAEMAGRDPRRDFPHLRALCCAGEPLGPARRRLLEDLWGVPIYNQYGMTETATVAMDCQARRLHPWQDHFHAEILDETLEREVTPGEVGVLVITSLTPRATPVIRYVTGDRVRSLEAPCTCGRTTTLEILGRAADTLWIGDRAFDTRDLQDIVGRLPARRFWKASPQPSGLRLVVERERDEDRIGPELLAELQVTFGVHLEVELVPKGTLCDRTEPLSFGVRGKPTYVEHA